MLKCGIRLKKDTQSAGIATHLPACGLAGCIKNVQIYHQGTGTLLCELNEYGQLIGALDSLTVPEHAKRGVLGKIAGVGYGDDDVTATGAIPNYTRVPRSNDDALVCMIPIKHTLLSMTTALPMRYTTGLRVQIRFASGKECLVVGKGGAQEPVFTDWEYEILQPKIVADAVEFSTQQRAQFDAKFASSGFKYYFTSYGYHYRAWPEQSASVAFGSRYSSVKDVLITARTNEALANPVNRDILRTRYGAVKKYQFDVGGRLSPLTPLEDKTQMLHHAFQAFHGALAGEDLKNWNEDEDSSFVIAHEQELSKTLLSGDSTMKAKNVDMILNLTGKDDHKPSTLSCFVHYDMAVVFAPDGSVRVLQ